MSRENVDFVRRGYDAFNERDWPAVVEQWDDEVVFHDDPALRPDPATYRGKAEVRSFFTQVLEAWDQRVDYERFFSGGDKVVAFVRLRGRFNATGIEADLPVAHLFTIRGGKTVDVRMFADREAALEAAGLAP